MERAEKLLALLLLDKQKGLEIGPLASLIVLKSQGDVRYLDYRTTADLKQRYANDPAVTQEKIMEIDYALEGKSLSKTVGDDVPFDYVIASHVIEHLPNAIGWMQDVSSILKPGGVLALAIPDMRYTFDINRPLSSPGGIDCWVFRKTYVSHVGSDL